MIALDTETTGLDLRHGAKPFFVTIAGEEGTSYWEWPVDPLTRQPCIPTEDLREIMDAIDNASTIVGQNIKFDCTALESVGLQELPWNKVYDTLLAGHLLASNKPHNLTDMAVQYLGVNIQPYENALENCVKECRRQVQQAKLRSKRGRDRQPFKQPTLPGVTGPHPIQTPLEMWKIAEEGLPDMPSVKASKSKEEGKIWRNDLWLPAAMALHQCLPTDHLYWTVCRDYANADSSVTLALWSAMKAEIQRRGLWEIYLERLKVLPVIHRMENDGLTVSAQRLYQMTTAFKGESQRLNELCVGIARGMGHNLTLPKGATNDSLRSFLFNVLELEPIRNPKAKTDEPTTNKAAMEYYANTLPQRSRPLLFIKSLLRKREIDTALAFMDAYQRFWIPMYQECPTCRVKPGTPILCQRCLENREKYLNWYRIHPSLNPTGTDTLRMSSENPNAQQISKHKEANLRECFGPAPGREWWSLDAANIELRIPAFEADETDLMAVFLKPKEPPYFGSYHLVIFDLLHPELFKQYGKECKNLYEDTWYQWVKNGNFAVIYGAQEETADRTYHVPGAYQKLRHRFPKMAKLNDRMINHAEKYGYVETIPDKSVNPKRGYPVLCSRTEWGKISPTVPLNYHVQSTACWWMARAMVRVADKLDDWNLRGFDGRMILQVHDELVFDFPKSDPPPQPNVIDTFNQTNVWRIREIQKLMEKGGEDIGVPTPVNVDYHPESWAKSIGF